MSFFRLKALSFFTKLVVITHLEKPTSPDVLRLTILLFFVLLDSLRNPVINRFSFTCLALFIEWIFTVYFFVSFMKNWVKFMQWR